MSLSVTFIFLWNVIFLYKMDQLDSINPIERRLVEKATRLRIPITANFEITPYCNLCCDMCYVRMGKHEMERQGGLLPLDTWIRFAEELKEMGTLFILLTGGEPLTYPGFRELYLQLRKMGFIITMNTNATLIDEGVAQLFAEYKPRRVNVTLYGGNNDTYHRLCHVQQGYDRCVEGLEWLHRYGIDARINLTLLKENQADYESLLATADRLGMPSYKNCYTSLFCRDTCTSQKNIVDLRMSPQDVAALELDHQRRQQGEEKFREFLQATARWMQQGRSVVPEGLGLECHAGRSSCWISWQGRMTPCVDMVRPGISLLDRSVSEAWREIVSQSDALPKHTECSGCTLRTLCDVCYANATNEKHYCGSVDYLCAIAQAKQQLIVQLLQTEKER